MLRRTYDNQDCSVARTLEVVGERWTLLIVRDALMGICRFDEFRRRLGIAASVLSVRLDMLLAAGIIERLPYHSRPVRYEYHLTAKGHELAVIVFSLMRWGDRHLAGESGPPVTTHHSGCGGEVASRLVCEDCAAELTTDEIDISYVQPARHWVPAPHT
jgi:DNA-binding HxlR family transcriptional regulator